MMLVEILKWVASISGIIAALMVAGDLGRRITGWGFVIFAGSSIVWIVSALLADEPEIPLASQNGVLFLINLLGIWRYLVRKKPISN